MQAREIMTEHPATVTPDETARRVARLMAEHDCGCLPVVDDGGGVIGVVTDRDLAIRGLGEGRGPDTPVRDLMTPDPNCCPADADIREVERVMADWQVRRVVVVDDDGHCVGVISQADLARAAETGRGVSDQEVALVVERISEPANIPIDHVPYRHGSAGSREQRL